VYLLDMKLDARIYSCSQVYVNSGNPSDPIAMTRQKTHDYEELPVSAAVAGIN
jgi:hypothetical protein